MASSSNLYQNLSLPTGSAIRLLKLQPGYQDDDLHCTLEVVANAQAAGSFEALSYVWGSLDGSGIPLYVNSHEIGITLNLANALRRLRPLPPADQVSALSHEEKLARKVITVHNSGDDQMSNAWSAFAHRPEDLALEERAIRLPLWVDSVCINQSDQAERTSQVRLMREIYESAATVNIWLGYGFREPTTIALSLTAHALLNLEVEVQQAGSNWKGIERENFSSRRNLKRGFPAESQFLTGGVIARPWVQLNIFYGRCDYFTRVWVIQEVALSKRARVFTDDFEIEWEAMGIAALWLERKGYGFLCRNLQRVAFFWEMTQSIKNGKRPPLLHLLRDSISNQSTDPRDRIFALLGLAEETLHPPGHSGSSGPIIADYALPAVEVFRNTTRFLLEHSQSLEILTFVDHPYLPIGGSPSWVPSWQSDPSFFKAAYQRRGPRATYKAGGSDTFNYNQTTRPDTLVVRGYDFDRVSFVGGAMEKASPTVAARPDPSFLREAWAELCRRGKDNYPTKENILNVFLLTLTAGVSAKGELPINMDWHVLNGRQYLNNVIDLTSINPSLSKRYQVVHLDKNKTDVNDYTLAFAIRGRRFILTEKGYFGLASHAVRKGDAVAVLVGSELPLILRPLEGTGEYRFAGDAYVHGVMNGEIMEAMRATNVALKSFTLR